MEQSLEGPPTKKHHSSSLLDQAWENLYIYRANAFLDYMRQASEEDLQWAKSVFRVGNRPSYYWHFDDEEGNSIRLINGLGNTMFQVRRDLPIAANSPMDPFPLLRYPWILPGDDSVSSVLSRDVLILIYGYILDPKDKRSFMMVNKLFHKAGAAWSGYDAQIEKILVRWGLDKTAYPFKDPSFKCLYQYFFAFCFISCKTDKELSDKILKAMYSKRYDALIVYCGMILGKLTQGGYLVWDGDVCTWIRPESNVERVTLVLDSSGFNGIEVESLRSSVFFSLLN